MFKCLSFVIIFASLVTGCSNVKPYKSTLPVNLSIKAQTESDVTPTVDIYAVDKVCQLTYQGRVEVTGKLKKVGITENKPSYLVVNFAKSSFWSGQSSSMSSEVMLSAKPGYSYQMDLSYLDAIYDIKLESTHLKSGKTRPVEPAGLGDCDR